VLAEHVLEGLRSNLALLRHDIVLDLDAPEDHELSELVTETASVSSRVTVRRTELGGRRPAVAVRRSSEATARVVFSGTPGGHEFTSFVLALLHVGGHPPRRGGERITAIGSTQQSLRFTTFYSQSCQNCPEVVQTLNSLAALCPNVTAEAIDGGAFTGEIEELGILALPTVLLNGELFHQGRAGTEELLDKILAHSSRSVDGAGDSSPRDPYDVLVVGGGPAGVAAAIYAARKGLRTGLVADRIGGQVLDTMAIENLVAVAATTGPELAGSLDANLTDNAVEVLRGRKATALTADTGRLHTVQLEGGTELQARGIVLAPGARWRTLGVPGESEYRNKGVTFCPHCDGPLFRNQRVAVIGGGNSGLEAALDLAGIAAHVTIIEYSERLRADSVLVEAVRKRANIEIVTGAETLAIEGDGRSVNTLLWRDRTGGEEHRTGVAGVFVQIGLIPNTDWLDGAVQLNERGEIEIDERGRTSAPRVVAAGDATTIPYKQIVSALGAGATASIALFEEMIASGV
jgi:alkyl hydroperoxide reductase subunit F